MADLRTKTNAIVSELTSQLTDTTLAMTKEAYKHCLSQLLKYIQSNVFLTDDKTKDIIDEINAKIGYDDNNSDPKSETTTEQENKSY